MSQQTRRLLLVVLGFAAVGVGLWWAAQLVRDIVYQAQGKCDYLDCTTSWTLPYLAAALVLVAAGAALVAWTVFLSTRRPSSEAEAHHASN